MTDELDPRLRRMMEANRDNPKMVRGIANVLARMWFERAREGFPEHFSGFTEEPAIYRHPLFDFVNSDARIVIGEDVVSLTLAENRLLTELCRNLNRAVTREGLRLAIIGDHALDTDSKTVNVHIFHLRRKIAHRRDITSPIETAKGIGYRLVDPTVPNGYGTTNYFSAT